MQRHLQFRVFCPGYPQIDRGASPVAEDMPTELSIHSGEVASEYFSWNIREDGDSESTSKNQVSSTGIYIETYDPLQNCLP